MDLRYLIVKQNTDGLVKDTKQALLGGKRRNDRALP
jgi:hypothetical protein